MSDLVKGYLKPIYNNNYEILCAVCLNGKVYATGPVKKPNNHFNPPGSKWVELTALPENLEFIGNYPSPV